MYHDVFLRKGNGVFSYTCCFTRSFRTKRQQTKKIEHQVILTRCSLEP